MEVWFDVNHCFTQSINIPICQGDNSNQWEWACASLR